MKGEGEGEGVRYTAGLRHRVNAKGRLPTHADLSSVAHGKPDPKPTPNPERTPNAEPPSSRCTYPNPTPNPNLKQVHLPSVGHRQIALKEKYAALRRHQRQLAHVDGLEAEVCVYRHVCIGVHA